jgi:hypothetical protein
MKLDKRGSGFNAAIFFFCLVAPIQAQYQPRPATGGGGSVSSIGVTTVNGISGTSSGGSNPRLTLSLDAIMPSSITLSGGNISTLAGVSLNLQSTPPAATTHVLEGIDATFKASDAAVGAEAPNGEAESGGEITIQAGDAKNQTSGDANGGDVYIVTGAGTGGSAASGSVYVRDSASQPAALYAGPISTSAVAIGSTAAISGASMSASNGFSISGGNGLIMSGSISPAPAISGAMVAIQDFLLDENGSDLVIQIDGANAIVDLGYAGSPIYYGSALQLNPVSAPPLVSAAEGAIYANSDDHHLYFYNGTTWKQLDN